MCGIAGFISTKPQAHHTIHQVISGIESRGGHAWGWATPNMFYKEVGKVPTITAQLKFDLDPNPSIMITHSRFATHGSAEDVSCAHPFVSARWAIAHNGVIDNDHKAQKTKCDSEAILKILIETNDIKKMAEQLVGQFRICIIDKQENKLIIVNDDSPVWFGKRWQSELWFASEAKHLPLDCWMRPGKANTIMTFWIDENNHIQVKMDYFTKKTRSISYTFRDWDEWQQQKHPITVQHADGTIITRHPDGTTSYNQHTARQTVAHQNPVYQPKKGHFNYQVCQDCKESDCKKCPMVSRCL